jgi:hypothetical protein
MFRDAGDKRGCVVEVIGTRENIGEYASRWATVQPRSLLMPVRYRNGSHAGNSSRTRSVRLKGSSTSMTR